MMNEIKRNEIRSMDQWIKLDRSDKRKGKGDIQMREIKKVMRAREEPLRPSF
jgi:hypothetical protein